MSETRDALVKAEDIDQFNGLIRTARRHEQISFSALAMLDELKALRAAVKLIEHRLTEGQPASSDVFELFKRITALEQPDGTWPAPECVDVLTAFFAERGLM